MHEYLDRTGNPQMSLRRDVQYIVAGATGWLGRATLDRLERSLGTQFTQRVLAFASANSTMILKSGTTLPVLPLHAIDNIKPQRPVVLFHYAFRTKDKIAGMTQEEYQKANLSIREQVSHALKSWEVSGLVLPSSGAVPYFLKNPMGTDSLSLYGRGKAEDEDFFTDLSRHQRFRLVMPRIFNLSGPYINKWDLYALSSILLACIEKRDIVLHADHPVWRSYYGVEDLVDLMLAMTEDPEGSPEIFDTAGHEATEVGELAYRCCQITSSKGLKVIRPFVREEPNSFYVGNDAILRSLEERYHLVPQNLDRQILTTAAYMKKRT